MEFLILLGVFAFIGFVGMVFTVIGKLVGFLAWIAASLVGTVLVVWVLYELSKLL